MKELTPQQLALYLGCEATYTHKYANAHPFTDKINGYDIKLIEENDHNYIIKPHLRLLSDITKEEANEVGTTAGGLKRDLQTFNACAIQWMPADFAYLLSKGFDLFNWIEQGLALDKTKLAVNAK